MQAPASKAVSALLAVAAPALLCWGAWGVLSREEPWAPSERVLAFEAELDAGAPDVVVIGSSYAIADTNPSVLAEGLGQPHARIVVVAIAGSPSAVWYAALKARVFDRGVRPRLVVAVANMGGLMQDAVGEASEGLLFEQLPHGDEALAAKAGMAAANDPWARISRNRARLRDAWRGRFREGAVAAVFGDPTLAESAAAVVFAAEARDGMERRGGLMPGVGAAAGEVDLGRGNDDPARSFLPELAALTQAHGAQFAVALPPTLPSHPAGQRLSAEGERRVLTWARSAPIGWVDLRHRAYPPSAYSDGRHLSASGARTFSTELGQALAALGGLDGPLRPPELPATAERTGPIPALPPTGSVQEGCVHRLDLPLVALLSTDALHRAGAAAQSPLRVRSGEVLLEAAPTRRAVTEGCAGNWVVAGEAVLAAVASPEAPAPAVTLAPEAVLPEGQRPATTWVYPGGSVRWSWSGSPAREGRIATVRVGPVGGGAGRLFLVAGDARSPLLPDGGDLVGEVALPASGTSLAVEAEAEAPFAWVKSLSWAAGDEVNQLVREVPPREVSLFTIPPTYAAPPPAATQIPMPAQGGRGRFLVEVVDRVGCLRWEVTENGTPLPSLVIPRATPLWQGPKTQRSGDSVYFFSSDGSSVEGNGRAYRLTYREDRRCAQSQWLLAGDTLTQTLKGPLLRGLLGPPRTLKLSASSDHELHDEMGVGLQLSRGERVVLDTRLNGAALGAGVTLDIPAPSTNAEARVPIRVTITADPDGPDLLLHADVTDGPAPAGAGESTL